MTKPLIKLVYPSTRLFALRRHLSFDGTILCGTSCNEHRKILLTAREVQSFIDDALGEHGPGSTAWGCKKCGLLAQKRLEGE